MTKNRMEAFSDGVIAVIITIMVLELHVPHGDNLEALKPLLPTFLCYVLSFIYVAIYWNNHHHMMHTVSKINGSVLWANAHLLFWLSLIPFATAWMGENHFGVIPIVIYGVVLFMNGLAYYILEKVLIRLQGEDSMLAKAVGQDWKSIASTLIYIVSIVCALFISQKVALCGYTFVAAIWLIPDRRIERLTTSQH